MFSSSRATFVVVLFLFSLGTIGCETSKGPSSNELPGLEAKKSAQTDTIYVDYVGAMTSEQLFNRFMDDQFYGDQTAEYAAAVLKTEIPGAVDSVFAYVNRYKSSTTLKQVAQAKLPELGPWLQANAHNLPLKYWSDVGSTLSHNGWRDSVVAEVLMEQVCCNEDKRSRSASARAFVGMGTLEEVRRIAAIGDTSSWKSMRWTAISAQARFDVPEFNQQVRAALRDTSRLHTRMLEGLEENHRHDFLPELRIARKQLQGTWPNYSMSYLDDLIAELEEKKEAGVPPGAPLDYPNTTRADSTSTR